MQQRLVIMELWPANAKIQAEAPGGWRLEQYLHRLWVENRQHAHAQPVCTGCQIQILNGHGRALFQCLRHAVPAQTVAGSWCRFGEYGQLQWGGLQTMQLQLPVAFLSWAVPPAPVHWPGRVAPAPPAAGRHFPPAARATAGHCPPKAPATWLPSAYPARPRAPDLSGNGARRAASASAAAGPGVRRQRTPCRGILEPRYPEIRASGVLALQRFA